jgi:hypothetical protein
MRSIARIAGKIVPFSAAMMGGGLLAILWRIVLFQSPPEMSGAWGILLVSILTLFVVNIFVATAFDP